MTEYTHAVKRGGLLPRHVLMELDSRMTYGMRMIVGASDHSIEWGSREDVGYKRPGELLLACVIAMKKFPQRAAITVTSRQRETI